MEPWTVDLVVEAVLTVLVLMGTAEVVDIPEEEVVVMITVMIEDHNSGSNQLNYLGR